MAQTDSATLARPLRVLLIGNYEPDRQQSMQRYTRELADGLRQQGVEVAIIVPPTILGRFALGSASLLKWLGYLDKYVLFAARLFVGRRRYDIVHITDHANAIYRRWLSRDTVVVTCHDLFAVRGMLGLLADHRPRSSGRQLQRMILNGLRNCPAIICISQATADDVRTLVEPELLDVIPNAIRDALGTLPAPQVDAALAAAGIAQPYFLHVGGNQFYKNRPGVVRVFDAIADDPAYAGHRLVLAGKAPDEALSATIAAARHRDRITILVAPDDDMIEALYTRATALLFLSTAEGFGWPIVEAQACGCVVAAADRAPMNGIGGDAAILIDPADEPDAARRIIAGLATADIRRTQGLHNAARYRPHQIYGEFLTFYRQLLGLTQPTAGQLPEDQPGHTSDTPLRGAAA